MKKSNIGTLDRHASALCRARGYCEACGRTDGLQAAHIVGRKVQATRWQKANLLCLCATCHAKFHDRPVEFGLWCEQYLTHAYVAKLHYMSHILRPDIKPALTYLEVKQHGLDADMYWWWHRLTGRSME